MAAATEPPKDLVHLPEDTTPSTDPTPSQDDDVVVLPNGMLYRYFLHPDARLSKLATHEDPYHVHKTLGILAILSFIYRYAVVYNSKGTLGFDGSVFDWLNMAAHLCLSASSIEFRVPRKRLSSKPMVIYEEYRQHAIVFTLRCFSVFALSTCFPTAPAYVIPGVVLLHHVVVDRITAIHGSGSTAVRAANEKIKTTKFYQRVAMGYSFYQFLALGSVLYPTERRGDMGYNSLIAIQSSAFLMTLYRKKIVRGKTHMVVYSACLLLSAFHIVRVVGMGVAAMIFGAFMLRVHLPQEYNSKYVIWALFLLAVHGHEVSALVSSPTQVLHNVSFLFGSGVPF